ncbi:effector-associated constant component EACC1 [Streptomyces hirsutus]|uniref:effector-associated constant component EACC1 n=1 Tax=Streptomyces hirsutus TaxID=35620 RepID=UPI0036845CCC
MAEGDGVANQGIRIRLDDTASTSDIGALRKWLEREKPLDERARAGDLQIQERPRTDESGTPMGLGMDIVVLIVGAGAGAIATELLDQVKKAVSAWRANRRDVEDGVPPQVRVEPVNLDDR